MVTPKVIPSIGFHRTYKVYKDQKNTRKFSATKTLLFYIVKITEAFLSLMNQSLHTMFVRWFLKKYYPFFISLETTTDKGSKIIPLDRENYQLQNTTCLHSYHYSLCIYARKEQKSICLLIKIFSSRSTNFLIAAMMTSLEMSST